MAYFHARKSSMRCGKHFHEGTADTADLSTTLRSGRDDKGEGALPATVVAEQDPFFITLGGPKAHDSSGRKTFPGKVRWTADLSTTLLRSSGRDDKGEGGASNNSSC